MADAPAEPAPQAPPAATPAAAEGEGAEGEKVSKKGAKKAEAKAKKEAEKARKAAEREAAEAAKKAAGGDAGEDLAKDNYGPITPSTALAAPVVKLSDISEEHVGKSIQVAGWVQRTRMQGVKMCFIEFRANRGWTVQGVIAASGQGKPVSRPMVKWIGSVSPESYVLIEATVQKPLEPVKSCRVSDFELHVTKLYLVAAAPRELGMSLATSNRPITSFEDDEPAKAATDDKAADAAVEEVQQGVENVSINTVPGASLATHLANVVLHKRAPAQQAIAYCRKAVRKLFAEYLEERGFTQFEPPCLIGAASEGGGNVFGMPYFEKTAYLAQSPQFYKQFEIAAGFERVYSIGPVFRAENSNTPRHLTEFTGLDLEMEIGTQKDAYHEAMDILEGVLLYIFRGLKERCAEHIEAVRAVYPSEDFLLPKEGEKTIRLTFAEGQKLLREEGPEEYRNVSDDEDMSTPQEKALGALIRKKYNTDFYILDKFPETARPFYALEDPENPKVTNAYDFFMRGQEILSGGQRIHDPDTLVARIKKKGVDPESQGIKQYVSVFREAGCPPHAGGGIGLDRVVAWYLNLPSVHLASYYPRTPKRLMP